jgi:hypothetical protein
MIPPSMPAAPGPFIELTFFVSSMKDELVIITTSQALNDRSGLGFSSLCSRYSGVNGMFSTRYVHC